MSDFIEMTERNTGNIVRVYQFLVDNGNPKALVFDPAFAGKQNGNGWRFLTMKTLIPKDYAGEDGKFQSKTIKNKAKDRMTLVDAIWRCTDGTEFKHADLEQAITHELELMEKERKSNE